MLTKDETRLEHDSEVKGEKEKQQQGKKKEGDRRVKTTCGKDNLVDRVTQSRKGVRRIIKETTSRKRRKDK